MLPVSDREVDGVRFQIVDLPNPEAAAALEARLLNEARGSRRCRIALALETLVTVRCTISVAPEEGGGTETLSRHFAISESGEVTPVGPESVFIPGVDLDDWIPVWVQGSTLIGGGDVALTSHGLVRVWLLGDEEERVPWRTMASLIRADGPLGPALVAKGLTLAAPGAVAPVAPPKGFAVSRPTIGELVADYLRLPLANRGSVRLFVPPEGRRLLVFPHGTPRAGLETAFAGARVVDGYMVEPLARGLPVQATERVAILARPGARDEQVGVVPKGSQFVAFRGSMLGRASEPAGRGWVYGFTTSETHGWMSARHVTPIDGCVVSAPSDGSETVELIGKAEWRAGAVAHPVAWFVRRAGTSTSVTLHALEGCVVGAEIERYVVEGRIEDLAIVATEERAGVSLLVLVVRGAASPSMLVVFTAGAQTPTLSRPIGDGELIAPQLRGPDRRRGYFPFGIEHASEPAWFSWNGTGLEESRREP